MLANVPAYDTNGNQDVTICLTAAQDIARFVTRAIDLPEWPAEFKIYGYRTRVKDLAMHIQQLKGMFYTITQMILYD